MLNKLALHKSRLVVLLSCKSIFGISDFCFCSGVNRVSVPNYSLLNLTPESFYSIYVFSKVMCSLGSHLPLLKRIASISFGFTLIDLHSSCYGVCLWLEFYVYVLWLSACAVF